MAMTLSTIPQGTDSCASYESHPPNVPLRTARQQTKFGWPDAWDCLPAYLPACLR